MTTIIGLQYKDSCFLVADSRVTASDGYIYSDNAVEKISERGLFLIAGSGEVTPCDVVQHIWEPPTPTKQDKKNLFHFMVSKAIPSLRRCLIDNGYNFDEPKTETRFQFLIAVCGELFDVDDSLGVSKNSNGVYGAGSGAPYAVGAIHAGADAYEAMEIASKLTAFTAPPYISKEQFKHIS